MQCFKQITKYFYPYAWARPNSQLLKNYSNYRKDALKLVAESTFSKDASRTAITPNTLRNIKLPIYLKLPSILCSLDYLHKFCMKKSLQHLHFTLHRHIDEYEKALLKLSITSRSLLNTTLFAINQCYHNCVDYNKKHQIKNIHGYKKKTNTDIILTTWILTKSLICAYLIIYLQQQHPR